MNMKRVVFSECQFPLDYSPIVVKNMIWIFMTWQLCSRDGILQLQIQTDSLSFSKIKDKNNRIFLNVD